MADREMQEALHGVVLFPDPLAGLVIDVAALVAQVAQWPSIEEEEPDIQRKEDEGLPRL